MEIQEFISSGILEVYSLGAATPEECAEVEKMSAIHPEIKQELDAIEDTMNSYVSEHSVEPTLGLKDKILSQPSAISHQSSANYWSIAATFLFLISAGFAIYFGVRSNTLDGYLDNMAKINNTLSDSIKAIATNERRMEDDMAILKDPMYKIVELKGMKPAPEAKVMVCWCPMDKKVYIEVDKLPAAPSGMQYQLWAFVDGKPVSEGMLGPGAGLHRMPDVDKAEAFAVTLEKQGGSLTPKGDIYVKGDI